MNGDNFENFGGGNLGNPGAYDRRNDSRDTSPESGLMPSELIMKTKAEILVIKEKIKEVTQKFDEMSEDEFFSSRHELEEIALEMENLKTSEKILRDKILTIIEQISKLDGESLTSSLRGPDKSN